MCGCLCMCVFQWVIERIYARMFQWEWEARVYCGHISLSLTHSLIWTCKLTMPMAPTQCARTIWVNEREQEERSKYKQVHDHWRKQKEEDERLKQMQCWWCWWSNVEAATVANDESLCWVTCTLLLKHIGIQREWPRATAAALNMIVRISRSRSNAHAHTIFIHCLTCCSHWS